MKYTVQMVSDGIIYVPSFMKIGTGVQAILRFYLENLRGCNVGITDGIYGLSIAYAVVMCSGSIIYIPCFINIGSAIQKLMGGGGGGL
jgi:hypothetical protein